MRESCDGPEGYPTRRKGTRGEEVKSMIKAAEEEEIGRIKRFRLALLAAVAIVGIVDIAMPTTTTTAPEKEVETREGCISTLTYQSKNNSRRLPSDYICYICRLAPADVFDSTGNLDMPIEMSALCFSCYTDVMQERGNRKSRRKDDEKEEENDTSDGRWTS
jgi:hypothetical protein